jgi:hypothetical protein
MTRLMIIMLLALPALPATAHHPGERIDEVMTEQEPGFEATDLRRTPQLRGTGTGGERLELDTFRDKIVVVSFAPKRCGASCAAQQALLKKVQEGVNVSPMRDWVVFLTVGATDAAGWDETNWQSVMAQQGVVDVADSFAALSERDTTAPMVHVVARGGRHAGIFHGADFGRVNLILYISELVNAPPPEPGLLDQILGVFR